ncbi:putative receptor-like protein kinase [Senna tora]|uniref:Putative receptor-like protein kinase n=1 Tax=Senna tora TaxID=362788 RepID=A0A834THQ8_9FABA|nr:putative receptor-like protein kinase [Senna tora]
MTLAFLGESVELEEAILSYFFLLVSIAVSHMGTCNCKYKFLVGVLSIFWFLWVSLGDYSGDNILIDCGSSNITKVGDRVFQADNDNSTSGLLLSTSEAILVKAESPNLLPSSSIDESKLYQTARILKGVSQYTFPIKTQGRHWIRLHFFPFSHPTYNMSTARFSVSAQNTITLLKDFQMDGFELKEYSLNITETQLVLTFTPSSNSFAFLNALEVISIPDKVIPQHVNSVNPQGDDKSLFKQALETIARVNMGNQTVSPLNDTLGRVWVSDDSFLIHNNLVHFASNISAVSFKGTNISEDIAPLEVYGTLTKLSNEQDPRTKANVTWLFDVDPGFDYLLRFHFCDVVNLPPNSLFNVYVNSWLVSTVNLDSVTPHDGAPYYMDAITRISGSRNLNVSVGIPNNVGGDNTNSPSAFLNGLEIMKMSNSKNSLVLDLEGNSKKKLGIIVGSVIALVVLVLFVVVMAVFLLYRRRRNGLQISHENGNGNGKEKDLSSIFSRSKIGYRFPLAAIQKATSNFSEDLVIGVGGFGKVYKGVFTDGTIVAVKRGASQSQQGLAEFKTEIEMLSQFRHRHLVSLIGYCNEQDERIIIYEYMEKGTLKNHLYGSSDVICLSWRQRLEACIGAAKGLHYLHTGSAKAIIHRDVKSANILLDENFMAKVADFGLSKTGPEIDKTHVSTAVKGSFGYLDPEYLTTQQLTEKSDIYSFGVVMFEVLCGRPVIDPSLPREKVNLVEWVMKCLERKQLEEIIDPRLAGQLESDSSLQKFVEIAEKCLAEHGTNRPTMGDVLWHLEFVLRQEVGVGRESSRTHQIHRSDTGLSSMDYTMGSVGDLSDVSMSKVFAQMVNEDVR